MRQLHETELFNKGLNDGEKKEIINAINGRLNQGAGIIAPQHIEPEFAKVKIKAKVGMSLLGQGVSMYESFNGRIKLFNLGLTASGRSPIPAFMPFVLGKARNKQKESELSNTTDITSPAIYMNLHRIGHWSKDEKQYERLNAATDLSLVLESGAIMYKLLYENQSEKLFDNSIVLETLTRIYSHLFAEAVIRTRTTFGNDFNTDAAYYMIAKFFLTYVLKKPVSETVDTYAHGAIKGRDTSLEALKMFEENNDIDYTSLSKFLETIGAAFYYDKIDLGLFVDRFTNLYGEGVYLGIEYVPYLLHFLIAMRYGATLGGTTRLYKRHTEFGRDLPKLLNAISTTLR